MIAIGIARSISWFDSYHRMPCGRAIGNLLVIYEKQVWDFLKSRYTRRKPRPRARGSSRLVETESQDADTFKRFRGVDLHTWDRVSISMGEDFAHLTIPGNGCVNAAPRIATLQGEDNAGRTTISFDGVELFA